MQTIPQFFYKFIRFSKKATSENFLYSKCLPINRKPYIYPENKCLETHKKFWNNKNLKISNKLYLNNHETFFILKNIYDESKQSPKNKQQSKQFEIKGALFSNQYLSL